MILERWPTWVAIQWSSHLRYRQPQRQLCRCTRAFQSSRVIHALPSVAYDELVLRGEISHDDRQIAALSKLDALYKDIEAWMEVPKTGDATSSRQTGFFSSFFGGGASEPVDKGTASLSDIPGVYLYGGVGCGKSFLMDILFDELPLKRKKRVHFHKFMLGVHQGIHRYKRLDRTADGIEQVVDDLAKEAQVLCFDEMQVSDIADAMILRRLFTALYARGLVVVATSNRAPGELYKGGLNREIFVPFIDLLKSKCAVHNMEAQTDYRTSGEAMAEFYFTPLDQSSHAKLTHKWKVLSHRKEVQPTNLTIFGRQLHISQTAEGMAWCTFDELCAKPLSAADYQALAQEFHTLFLVRIPRLNIGLKAEIKRFILLVDELYEAKVKLFATAQAAPQNLLDSESGASTDDGNEFMDALNTQRSSDMFSGQEEMFAFARAVSRLQEMQTKDYVLLPHVTHGTPEHIRAMFQ